jgi:multidrug efflux pump subunit AcrA (membrane-fusion protein)
MDQVRLQANVGEKDLAGIRVGSPVTVTMTGSGKTFTARVTSVFPFIDPGARTAVVEAVVQNDGRRLFPGQYVQMQFVTGEELKALSVPREAVMRSGDSASVWVVANDRVERRQVTTGLEGQDRVEIVAGLDEGGRRIACGRSARTRVTIVALRARGAGSREDGRASESFCRHASDRPGRHVHQAVVGEGHGAGGGEGLGGEASLRC